MKEREGGSFTPFTANQQEMGRLFESFVRNFLRREQDVFAVDAPKVSWDVDADVSSDSSWLPEMRTDVMLTNSAGRVLIEAKYYAASYQSQYEKKTLISGHLYQVLTYLSQLSAAGTGARAGVLLYAGAGTGANLQYRLGGHLVLVRSLDLNREWRDIHSGLIALAYELAQLQGRNQQHDLATSGADVADLHS